MNSILSTMLVPERVEIDLKVSGKIEALRAISNLLAVKAETFKSDLVFDILSQREALASTGIGSGVAVPHGRVVGVTHVRAALAIHREGIGFDAIDGRPVHIFFALLGPEDDTKEHLRGLAIISNMLRDPHFRAKLWEATDSFGIVKLVTERSA